MTIVVAYDYDQFSAVEMCDHKDSNRLLGHFWSNTLTEGVRTLVIAHFDRAKLVVVIHYDRG